MIRGQAALPGLAGGSGQGLSTENVLRSRFSYQPREFSREVFQSGPNH